MSMKGRPCKQHSDGGDVLRLAFANRSHKRIVLNYPAVYFRASKHGERNRMSEAGASKDRELTHGTA